MQSVFKMMSKYYDKRGKVDYYRIKKMIKEEKNKPKGAGNKKPIPAKTIAKNSETTKNERQVTT